MAAAILGTAACHLTSAVAGDCAAVGTAKGPGQRDGAEQGQLLQDAWGYGPTSGEKQLKVSDKK